MREYGTQSYTGEDYFTDYVLANDVVAARSAWTSHAGEHFASESMRGTSPDLTLTFGLYGAPWRWDFEGPQLGLSDDMESARQRLLEDARTAMWGLGTLSNDHWSVDAGAGWLGFATPHGHDELRVYDDVPCVIVLCRYHDRDQFSPCWLRRTVADAFGVAQHVMPLIYPQVRAVAAFWHFTNPKRTRLGMLGDGGTVQPFQSKTADVSDGPTIYAFDQIAHGLDASVQSAQTQLFRRLYDAFEVPIKLRKRPDQCG